MDDNFTTGLTKIDKDVLKDLFAGQLEAKIKHGTKMYTKNQDQEPYNGGTHMKKKKKKKGSNQRFKETKSRTTGEHKLDRLVYRKKLAQKKTKRVAGLKQHSTRNEKRKKKKHANLKQKNKEINKNEYGECVLWDQQGKNKEETKQQYLEINSASRPK